MNNLFKRHLISAATTFVSTFVAIFALAFSADSYTFTEEALVATAVSALIAATRALAKLVLEWYSDRL